MPVLASPSILGFSGYFAALFAVLIVAVIALAISDKAKRQAVLILCGIALVVFLAVWVNDEWKCKLVVPDGIWFENEGCLRPGTP